LRSQPQARIDIPSRSLWACVLFSVVIPTSSHASHRYRWRTARRSSAPCSRAIKEGEDERAGRWWWEQPENRECGIHTGYEEEGSGI